MRSWIKWLALSWALTVRLLPQKLQWLFGRLLGWLWFDVFRHRRFTVLKNLTIAFPEASKEERLRLARTSMSYLCYSLFEFLQIPLFNQQWLEQEVVFEGFEHYERAKAQGQGVLLVSLHTGNGDVAISSLALKGLDIHVISKKFKNQFANELWFGVRERLGAHFLEPHGSSLAFDILRICRKNGAVIFVIDQFMGRPYGIETTFFGRRTGTAYGLSLFAMKTKAPVVPVYTYRDQDLRTHVVFEEPVPFEKIEDKDLQIKLMTQKYNDRIESIVRRHREQWMWVHRRWKRWE